MDYLYTDIHNTAQLPRRHATMGDFTTFIRELDMLKDKPAYQRQSITPAINKVYPTNSTPLTHTAAETDAVAVTDTTPQLENPRQPQQQLRMRSLSGYGQLQLDKLHR